MTATLRAQAPMSEASDHVAAGATTRARWLVVLLFFALFALPIGGWITWKIAQPSVWDRASDGRIIGVQIGSIDRWYVERPDAEPLIPGFDRTYRQMGYMDAHFALGLKIEDGRVVGCATMVVGGKPLSRRSIAVQSQFGHVPSIPSVIP